MNVDHVIQYNFAKSTVDYLHRAGRLARLGQLGCKMTNFVRPMDSDLAKIIVNALHEDTCLSKILSYKPPRKIKKPEEADGSSSE